MACSMYIFRNTRVIAQSCATKFTVNKCLEVERHQSQEVVYSTWTSCPNHLNDWKEAVSLSLHDSMVPGRSTHEAQLYDLILGTCLGGKLTPVPDRKSTCLLHVCVAQSTDVTAYGIRVRTTLKERSSCYDQDPTTSKCQGWVHVPRSCNK